jgi:arylsulfatase A-like enzyme
MFTVRRPVDLRRGPYTYVPDDDWVPFATRFRARGYRTYAVIANPLLTPLTKGFDEVRQVEPDHDSQLLELLPVLSHLYWRLELARGRVAKPDTTLRVTESALDFLAREHDAPFLAWLHLLDPHDPYQPPAAWRGPLRPDQRSYFAPKDQVGDPSVIDLQNGLAIGLDDAFWAHVRELYDGEVHYVDASIGRILDALEARGLDANTLVVITADHGEEFLDHGSYYHGQSVYEELIRVPLIFIGPRVKSGRVIRSRVSCIDLVPTLEAYTGLDVDSAQNDRSLLPYLTGDGPSPRPRDILAEGTNTGEPRRALVAGDDKLIFHVLTGRAELYDLAADPLERRDIAALKPDLVAALRGRLDAISSEKGPLHPRADDTKMVHDLRALGYVE